MDVPIIDLSTPETLERDFYAWLRSDPSTTKTLAPQVFTHTENYYQEISEYNSYQQYYSYTESSESGSPSSLSCSSLDYEVPPPPQHEKDVARSSGRNQLGRTYSPGLPLSMNEREEIVKLFQNGWKICDISKRLCVTHSCVSKILNRYRQTGSVKPKDAKEGRTESPLVLAVKDYRSRLGMCRQSEIREQLIRDGICSRENAPSRSSINHILRTKLDIKRRKKGSCNE
ncbi:unnamed protein product [Caenorhabditis bovis]|uniref:Paired domain-containing protein n=1 Tax=Caenorhabditis bovis TaxID=2654633 RepID=A0A8S1EFI1_9PELO|nr:unnamed protein product [Caenorhabditis bovis]